MSPTKAARMVEKMVSIAIEDGVRDRQQLAHALALAGECRRRVEARIESGLVQRDEAAACARRIRRAESKLARLLEEVEE